MGGVGGQFETNLLKNVFHKTIFLPVVFCTIFLQVFHSSKLAFKVNPCFLQTSVSLVKMVTVNINGQIANIWLNSSAEGECASMNKEFILIGSTVCQHKNRSLKPE